MNTNTYGASNFKYKTNFGPIVVFADDEKKIKPYDDFEPSWNQYIPIYQNEETGQWFAKPHQMMSGEYGDFIIRSKGILPEGSIHAERITFFLSSEQEQQYGDLEMYYYRIEGKLYLQASATVELDEVVVIANSNNQDNEEVNTEQDEAYNVIPSDKSDAFVTVFVSDDGAKLERAYQQIDVVKNRELVLFAEKNDSTNFFGSVFRVLSGKQITESSIYPKLELSSILRSYTDTRSLSMEALSDLIIQHFKEKDDKSMFLYLAQKGMSFIKVASEFTLEPLGNIMYDIADEIDKELKIGDDRWKVPKDSEGDYNPLLPGYNVLTNEQTVEQIAGTINKNFINPFSKKIDTLIVELKTNTLTKHFIGNRLDNLNLFVSSIPEKVNEIVTAVFEFFKKSFEFYNALLVGIINSLVDLLKSIFEILGLIFKGLHAVVDQMSTVVNKVKSSLSFSLESLENMISVLSTVFTTDNLIAFIGFQVHIIKAAGELGVLAVQKAVSFFEEGVTVTLPYDAIGYYTGYVVGWIAQEVVMFMLTAGTGTLAKGIQGAVKSYTDLAKAIGKAIKNTANKAQRAFEFTVDNFLKAIQALKNFAKQIPQHIESLKGWIDELIASLKSNILLEQTARLQSKFPSLTFILIDEALSLLKLVLKGIWKTELDDVGLKFAKTEDGGMAFVYKEVELFKDNLQAAKAWLSDLLNKEKRGGKSLEEYLDELIRKRRKKLSVKNIEDLGKLGKNGAPIRITLVDNLGNEIGKLIRSVRQRKLEYRLFLEKKKVDLKSEVILMDKALNDKLNYDLPIKEGEDLMYVDFNVPKSITDVFSGLGTIMLDDSLAYFKNNKRFGKVDGTVDLYMKSNELYKDYNGESIILKQFWKGMIKYKGNVNKAAFSTFAGDWAKKNGFTRVVVENPKIHLLPNEVIIKFLKP